MTYVFSILLDFVAPVFVGLAQYFCISKKSEKKNGYIASLWI